MEEKTDIKAKTIKVDTGKGNTIKVTMSYGEQLTLEELLIVVNRSKRTCVKLMKVTSLA